MFSNTLTLTVAGATGSPFTLTRVNQDNYGSEYKFADAIQTINLKCRQSTDTLNNVPVNRHNMTIEREIFATPTAVRKFYTATITLRDEKGSGPTDLLAFWVGFNTLALTLDDGLVVGEV